MPAWTEEALRYLGVREADDDIRRKTEEMADMLLRRVTPRYVFRVCRLERDGKTLLLPEAGFALEGKLALQMLGECDQAALLACTLGAAFDALFRSVQHRSMADAVILDACGSAYVEAACDGAEKEISARYPEKYRTDRFSPGYGDLPLTLQPPLLRALDAERRLGLYFTSSCLMNPQKSVTAFIGLASAPQAAKIKGCARCALQKDCAYKKRGIRCGLEE